MASIWMQLPEDQVFSRLGVGESVTRAFDVFMHGKGIFVPIGLVQSLPTLVLTWAIHSLANKAAGTTALNDSYSYSYGQQQQVHDPYSAQINNMNDIPKNDVVAIFLIGILCSVVTMIGVGANIRAAAELYAGKEPSLVECVKEGFRRFCSLFLFGLLLFGVILCGSFAFGIAAALVLGLFALILGDKGLALTVLMAIIAVACYIFIYFYVAISFQITPASIVTERKDALDAMKRSWELIDNQRVDVFCAIFLLGLLNFMVGFSCGLIFGEMAPIIASIWNVVALPVTSILGTVLFFSIRVEKEGFNRATLVRDLGLNDKMGDRADQLLVSSGPGDYKPVRVEEDKGEEVV
jgi:hypothetical protein